MRICLIGLGVLLPIGLLADEAVVSGKPWTRHTIDASSRGADGVRFRDINADGLLDLTTGWEEGGVVRVYLHPGTEKVREAWPKVTVAHVASPEDAAFADLDGDGGVDVVSSCEGKTRAVFFHWAPRDRAKLLDASAWRTEPVPACRGVSSWMFALPMQVDGKHGIDLILGSKGHGAGVFWLEAPAKARDVASWKLHRICDAGWIMSLRAFDFDGDGDDDVLVTDRKGKHRGTFWLERPAADKQSMPWVRHRIDDGKREVLFLDFAEDPEGLTVAVPVKDRDVLFLTGSGDSWSQRAVTLPAARVGRSKGVALGDIDRDGKRDVVFSCEGANGVPGMIWWTIGNPRRLRDISGPKGVKYDRIELVDLDADGDLDVVSCEEREGLGVFWYENPTR